MDLMPLFGFGFRDVICAKEGPILLATVKHAPDFTLGILLLIIQSEEIGENKLTVLAPNQASR